MRLLIIIPDFLVEIYKTKCPLFSFYHFKPQYSDYEFSDEFITIYQNYTFFPFTRITHISQTVANLKKLYAVENYFHYDIFLSV